MNTKDKAEERLVRTSVMVPESVDHTLRRLARQGNRPLGYEIRHALERYVEQKDGAA